MQIEPLNFTHQELLEQKFRQMNLPLSEYSFANLYLFRHTHRYEVLKFQEEVFIKGLTRDQVVFIMLTSHPSQISHLILQKTFSFTQILYPIPKHWLFLLEKLILHVSFKESESDYLYATSKLATYAGRHLDGKRNQVKQLFDQHEVKSETFMHQLNDAQQILNDWQKEKAEMTNETDYLPCQEALQKFQRLQLHGRIVYVNQKPSGFIIGEELTKECYVVHFCKALRSIKGLYQYLYQDLAQSLKETYPWINLEQDLGISALRDSKLSYQPNFFLKKWRVKPQLTT